jgi:hypothetical protein
MMCKIQTCNDDVIEYLVDVTELAALIHRETFSVAEGRRLWIQSGRANLDGALQIRADNSNKYCTDVWANGRQVYRIGGGGGGTV